MTMTTLSISDLNSEKALDRKEMSEVSGGTDFSALLAIASPFITNIANDQYNIGAQSSFIGGGNYIEDGVYAPVQIQWMNQSNNA